MVALGFAVAWWGYLEVIYGWTLIKGWDVRWRDLANPVSPYQWPKPPGNPPPIPASQILPGHATPTTTLSTGASGGGGTPPAQQGLTPGSTTAGQ